MEQTAVRRRVTTDQVKTASTSVINRMPNRVNELNNYVHPATGNRCFVGEVLASLNLPLPQPHDQLNEASIRDLAKWYARSGIVIDPDAVHLLRSLQVAADSHVPWVDTRQAVPALLS